MKYALIGCGRIAVNHIKAVSNNGLELVAVCDIDPAKFDIMFEKANCGEFSGAERCADYVAMLDAHPEIELVGIATESGKHAEIALECISRGINVIIEKPMAMSMEDADKIIAMAEEKGVKVAACHQNRFNLAIQKLRGAVEQGRFGKLSHGSINVRWNRGRSYYEQAPWRGTWEQDGGGALMNQGVHGIDLILWMLGDEVSTLYGRAETLARDIPVEDTAAAVLNMKHGGICVIQGCTTAYPGFSSTFYIHGEKGTVVFNDEGILEWKFLDEADAPQRPDMGERVGGAGDPTKIGNYGHICLLRDIAQAVRDGRSPAIPPQEAALAVRVICSIYESTRTGRPIVF